MKIHVLTEDVASQIAAGEVVERPASVVKELVENAIDAGATQVTIRIEDAGRKLVEVADDGSGIPHEELSLAVMRHATSKIQSAGDLFHIRTLGFRGEALASIASVSRLTVVSRVNTEDSGGRFKVDGGRVVAAERAGVPVGTVVTVEELFYNVPARLKFLKSDTTERQRISEFISHYALAYPGIRFRLIMEGKITFQSSGNGAQREVLAAIYGAETAREMLALHFEEDPLNISGFISPVSLTRSNRKEISFFVNGRWIQDPALSSALLQAYHTYLMVGRYPLAALFIQVEPELVDVNVHPAKAEVRFRSPDLVFRAVQRAVRRAMLAYSPVENLPSLTWGHNNYPPGSPPGTRQIDPAWSLAASAEPGPDMGMRAQPPTALPGDRIPLLRVVGQIGAAYLVAEGPDGLYLIDQHAAHERILFEKMMASGAGVLPSQTLLEPATVQLTPSQADTLAGQLPVLERYGFQVEEFGPHTFRVRAMPGLLGGMEPGAALRVLVEDFEEDETPLQNEVEGRLVARICKRAAVKAGRQLSTEEQKALVLDLENCTSPRTCPHGRPTMIHIAVDALERQFGRRGSR